MVATWQSHVVTGPGLKMAEKAVPRLRMPVKQIPSSGDLQYLQVKIMFADGQLPFLPLTHLCW